MDKNEGFTLIEVMLVIAIIAIYSTIGYLVMSGATKTASDTQKVSTISILQQGLRIYYTNNNETYPPVVWADKNSKSGGCAPIASLKPSLEEYVGGIDWQHTHFWYCGEWSTQTVKASGWYVLGVYGISQGNGVLNADIDGVVGSNGSMTYNCGSATHDTVYCVSNRRSF